MFNKIKFALLWLLAGGAFLIYKSMALKENAYNASLITKEEFAYPFVFLIFAILALVLKGNWNRKTNIIAGRIVWVVQLIVFADGFADYPRARFNLVTIFIILVVAIIIMLAKQSQKTDTNLPKEGVV